MPQDRAGPQWAWTLQEQIQANIIELLSTLGLLLALTFTAWLTQQLWPPDLWFWMLPHDHRNLIATATLLGIQSTGIAIGYLFALTRTPD